MEGSRVCLLHHVSRSVAAKRCDLFCVEWNCQFQSISSSITLANTPRNGVFMAGVQWFPAAWFRISQENSVFLPKNLINILLHLSLEEFQMGTTYLPKWSSVRSSGCLKRWVTEASMVVLDYMDFSLSILIMPKWILEYMDAGLVYLFY